ncbi:AAEL017182-PA, partial [Aedes aegypti]
MHTTCRTVFRLKVFVYRPLQLLGLLPISFDSKSKRFFQSQWNLLLSIVQTIIVSSMLPVAYYILVTMVYNETSGLSNLMVILELIIGYFLLVSFCVKMLLRGSNVTEILNIFGGIFFNVCVESDCIDENLLRTYLRKVILVDYILFPITFGMYIPFSIGWKLSHLISWLLNSYSIFLMLMIINLFQSTIISSSIIYLKLNNRVTSAVQTLRKLNENQITISGSYLPKVKTYRNLSLEINKLCYLHRMTTEAVQRMIGILSMPLLIITFFQFFVVLTEAYYNYIYLMNNMFIPSFIYGQILSSTLFMLMCLLQFYYTVSFSAQMTQRAEATAILLNESFYNDAGRCVEQSIEMFTLEMLHRDYRVRIYDCFALDFTLAHSVSIGISNITVGLIPLFPRNHL